MQNRTLQKTLQFFRQYFKLKYMLMLVTPLFIAVLIIMLYNLSQTVEHLSKTLIKQKTEETVRELDNFFNPVKNNLHVARRWGASSMLESLDPQQLNPQFIPLLQNYPQVSSMLIGNTKGREYMLLREDVTWLNRWVTYGTDSQRIWRIRWNYDAQLNGTIVKKWRDYKKYDPRIRPWFIGGLNAALNEIAWTKPYIFFTTKDPGITVSMNWPSQHDTTHFVIAYDIKLIDISAFTATLETSKNGTAFIITDDDKVIGLPRDERFKSIDTLKKYVLNEFDQLNFSKLNISIDEWKKNNKRTEPFKFKIDNHTWWAGFHPVPLGKENVFYIAVIVPEDDFMSEVNRTRSIIIAGFMLVMGLSLLVVRGYVQKQKAYAELEIKNKQILQQKEEIETQRDEIESQRDMIEEQNKEIKDSIRYSKRIQTAILPPEKAIRKILPHSFVFFRPKDIVSGDFYWFQHLQGRIMWAATDCTGHGVPGAFMSIIGHNGLNRAVREYCLLKPGEILDKLNSIVAETFRQEGISIENEQGEKIKDGMDIALCVYDEQTGILEFSAAFNPMFMLRKKEIPLYINGNELLESDKGNDEYTIYEIKADKQPIGSYDERKNFTTTSIRVEPGDTFYTFSDGFADQFGGPKGKKFMYKPMKEMMLNMQSLDMPAQSNRIDEVFTAWKTGFEQVDDVLIFGVRIK